LSLNNQKELAMTCHCCRLSANLVVLFTLLVVSTAAVFGQTTAARPDRGTRPNGSYSVSDIENISLQNGNVNLIIPLASLPPIAGGKLSWTLNAQYNSKIWDVVRTQQIGEAFDLSEHYYVVDSVQQSDRGGWRITGQYSIDVRDAHLDFDYQMPPVADEPDYSLMVNNSWYKVVMVMPDGSEHELRPVDYSPFGGGKEFCSAITLRIRIRTARCGITPMTEALSSPQSPRQETGPRICLTARA
jgi:hypothetical protein